MSTVLADVGHHGVGTLALVGVNVLPGVQSNQTYRSEAKIQNIGLGSKEFNAYFKSYEI